MSERPNIEAIAAKAGSDSHILQLSARDVWAGVDDVVRAQAQPLLGQDLIAQNRVYGLARQEGDIVVMDGNGLDEVQAVYRALAAPGVYRELVEESGWTPDEYERWVGDTLERYAAGGR